MFFLLNYSEIQSDLFLAPPHYSLAHCISADKALGAGIALSFRKRFPSMIASMEKDSFEVGKCYKYTCQDIKSKQIKNIFNLVTKDKSFQKPTYNNLELSLKDLKSQCIFYNIPFLAVPLLGCGLDNLNWERVSYILKGVFNDTNMVITVCIL